MHALHPALKIELQCSDQPYHLIPTSIQSLIFQFVRELLTNIAKHSGADYAVVKTSFTKGTFTLLVQDNGQGFAPDEKKPDSKTIRGFGLFNIRERLTSMNGSMTIGSQPEQGAEIIISIPISI